MIAIVLAAFISSGRVDSDTLSTKKLAENYKIFYNPPAVLISPREYSLPSVIPVPFFIRNDSSRPMYKGEEPATGLKDSLGDVKRFDGRLRQKK